MRRLSAGIPQTIDRAYAPMAFVATGVLEVERREVQLVGALHRCERDGEVLDREAGRVEDGDVARRLAAGRLSHENCAELVRLVLSDRPGLAGPCAAARARCSSMSQSITVRPRARNVFAVALPLTPAPITDAVSASRRPSVSAASTAAAPVRRAVTAPASSAARSEPSEASESR